MWATVERGQINQKVLLKTFSFYFYMFAIPALYSHLGKSHVHNISGCFSPYVFNSLPFLPPRSFLLQFSYPVFHSCQYYLFQLRIWQLMFALTEVSRFLHAAYLYSSFHKIPRHGTGRGSGEELKHRVKDLLVRLLRKTTQTRMASGVQQKQCCG